MSSVCSTCGEGFSEKEPRYRRPDGDVHVRCFEGPRILVVDDDPALRELVAYHVKRGRSCKVDTAADGHQALERIRAHVYDLILCDLRMPEMDGPTFHRQVQAAHPELGGRFVFMTAHASSDEYAAFVRDVGVPLLSKPFPREDLDAILGRVMGPVRHEQERRP